MPTHFPGRLSRPIGILVALALVAGLLIITPQPLRAADPKPDYLPVFDACPEDVIPDADFDDVSSRDDNAGDIDCIAYYGITKGTGKNRYSPDRPVTREHMALFLIRMAKLVGIDVPPPGKVPFLDTGRLSEESQDAISQLAQLGITKGTSDTTYSPARNVSRAEMALFLSRLMDLMDVPEHRGEVYGYIPSDVEEDVLEDEIADYDVDAPYNDMGLSTVEEFNAVEHLYELGVASGVSGRAYAPTRDMSRSHMADFMAAILDHSNLRPAGVTVQLTPTLGWEDYSITAMISARAEDFTPLDDERVDWFYAADADGGLQDNGECNQDALIEGDCIWDDDRDDLTDDFGNHFEELRAVGGETLTFYAWMGSRDDDEFGLHEQFGRAQAHSDKGPTKFVITSNIAENAGRISAEGADADADGAWIVDRDVQRSVRLTIQLEDEDGRLLQREGLEIAYEIREWDGDVGTSEVDNEMSPKPTFPTLSGSPNRRDDDETILTNERGETTLQLNRPRNEGVTVVTLTYEDADEDNQFAVVWSKDNPVVFSAVPSFETYRSRSSTRIAFRVDYDLYDQYGKRLNRNNNNAGRDGSLAATLVYTVYTVNTDGTLEGGGLSAAAADMTTSSSGRISYSLNTNTNSSFSSFELDSDKDYFVLINPSIRTEDNNNAIEATYARPKTVWIVDEAEDEGDYEYSNAYATNLRALLDAITEVDLEETNEFLDVSIDAGRDEFRTYFTVWEYDSNDDFFDADDNELTISQFEDLLKDGFEVDDLDIRLYSSNSARLSYFIVTR